MPKMIELSISFDRPRDLVLTLTEERYQEFLDADDYDDLWWEYEDQFIDHLTGNTTIDRDVVVGEYMEDDE